MSSASAFAFCSAMSMTSKSASSLSAIARATVAPTFPAPPTTVTLRFIAFGSSHVRNDSVGELRRLELGRSLHLARQVVRHFLLADLLLDPALDQARDFRPSQATEHHHAR